MGQNNLHGTGFGWRLIETSFHTTFIIHIIGVDSISFLKKYFQPSNNKSTNPPRICNAQSIAFKRRIKRNRKILFRFTIITLVFIVCTLPHQVLWLLIDFKYKGDEYFSHDTMNLAHLITYANCVINPLLYGQYNEKFRRNIRRMYLNLRKSMCTRWIHWIQSSEVCSPEYIWS